MSNRKERRERKTVILLCAVCVLWRQEVPGQTIREEQRKLATFKDSPELTTGILLKIASLQQQQAAEAATITGLAVSQRTIVTTDGTNTTEKPDPATTKTWTNTIVPANSPMRIAARSLGVDLPPDLPGMPSTNLWQVTCPECRTSFVSGAVFDRVSGGRTMGGGLVEEHRMRVRCTRPGCGREIFWTREVYLNPVVAIPIPLPK
jgi:hypothetical protein